MSSAPLVGVVMGSSSDWDTLRAATDILAEFGVPYEARVISAHRMPDEMFAYAAQAVERGLRAIIAGAGGAAHLPGMLASKMPRGIPVATFAIGSAGAGNAALFAIAMLAATDPALRARLDAFRGSQADAARAMTAALE